MRAETSARPSRIDRRPPYPRAMQPRKGEKVDQLSPTVILAALNVVLFVLWTLVWWGMRRMVARQDATEKRMQKMEVHVAGQIASREDLEAVEARISQQITQAVAPFAADLNTIKNLLIAGGLNNASR